MRDPTPEQQSIIAFARTRGDNLIVNALAGTGKTTTIEMICDAVQGIPILYLAFNRRIVDEATKRMPSHVECRTQNSLGHRVWGQACGRRLVVASDKMRVILKNIIGELPKHKQGEAWEDFSYTLKAIAKAKSVGYVPLSWGGHCNRISDYGELLENMEDDLSQVQRDLMNRALHVSIAAAYEGGIDYDDQIYMPVCFGGPWPKFPLVIIDEAQDLSPLNHEMLKKLVTKRLIAVGDPWQCHPPGTMITVTGGYRIPIEKLTKLSQVVSYFSQKTVFKGLRTQGRAILDIHESDYEGDLINIQTRSKILQMTPNHKCLVRMPAQKAYSVYLMQRGNQFRIGVARLAYPEGSGLSMRSRQEGADRSWILSTYPEKQIARVFENVYGAVFGIPQLLFNAPGGSEHLQPNINEAWRMIGNNQERGEQALKNFGRDIEFPLWSSGGDNPHFGSKSFITQACNLINGMYVCVMPVDPQAVGADKSANWQLIEVWRTPYKGKVYGLTVEPTEGGRRLYLANDIVTHNSIYAFRGAVTNGMTALKEYFDAQELPLSLTFRVPKVGVVRANARVPSYRAYETNSEGEIIHLDEWGPTDIPSEAAILCRNNAPLLSLGFKLLRNNRAIKLVGMDIGAGLVRILRKLGPLDLNGPKLAAALNTWLQNALAKSKAASAYDRFDCLVTLCAGRENLADAIRNAESIFKQEGPIQLLSIHKSKGLEWENVFHLDSFRIPSKFAQPDTEEWEQELNCRYVAETRFKKRLYLANLENFQDS